MKIVIFGGIEYVKDDKIVVERNYSSTILDGTGDINNVTYYLKEQ